MAAGSQQLRMREALPAWWAVARPWFLGAATRAQAGRYVLACLTLAVLHTYVAVRVSFAQKHFSTALANKDKPAWLAAIWEFVGCICLFAPVRALEAYAEKRVVAVWRTALTQSFITAYTTNRAYFHCQLARGTEGNNTLQDDSGYAAATAAVPAAAAGRLKALRTTSTHSGGSYSDTGTPIARSSRRRGSVDVDGGSGQPAAKQQQQHQEHKEQQQQPLGVVADLDDASAAVDNPDQRITADVASYAETSVSLVLMLIRKTLNCAAFTGVLWSISPRLVLFLISYALLGTFGTAALFGAPLTRLKQRLLRLEADLRFGLMRLREHAEAIAFYGGDAREAADLSARLDAVLRVLLARVAWLGGYEFWLTVYKYATAPIPSLVLAPEYFSGKVEFGVMSQATFAFHVLEEGLRLILEKLDDLSSLAAETGRLAGLLAALRAADIDAGGDGTVAAFGMTALSSAAAAAAAKQQHRPRPWWGRIAVWGGGSSSSASRDLELAPPGGRAADGAFRSPAGDDDEAAAAADAAGNGETTSLLLPGSNGSAAAAGDGGSGPGRVSRVLRLMDEAASGLSVEGLSGCVPGRHHQPLVVCRGLSFSLNPGESLLIMGPSGCGKSSLLRLLAGLWTAGSGTVRGPPAFFLPQRPYMPLGSLRAQLLFPTAGASQQQQQQQEGLEALPAAAAAHAQHDAAGAGSSHVLDVQLGHSDWAAVDGRLQQLLGDVNLGHLLGRYPGGLDAEVDWSAVLSLGEQQRVALIRVLFHAPRLAFLDEATAALDLRSEAAVYRQLRDACGGRGCFVSVGHRLQLLEWHSHVLSAAGPGGVWTLHTAAEFKQRLDAGLEG